MLFDDYQKEAATTCLEQCYNPEYLRDGLISEVGEVADLYKKKRRGDRDFTIRELCGELGDILWYVTMLCSYYNISLDAVAQNNLTKLQKRKADNKIQNMGDRDG